jgi:hypothetical protein
MPPRHHVSEPFHLPLARSGLISRIPFGFATSFFAVVIAIVTADFCFAPPEFDFSITWEDVLGGAFGVVGSFAALVIDEFLSFLG